MDTMPVLMISIFLFTATTVILHRVNVFVYFTDVDKAVVPDQQRYVSIQTRLECETTNDEQRLAIVGSIPDLGNWNPMLGVQAIQIPPNSGIWYAKFKCPVNEDFEMKLVRFGYDKSVEWETRSPRKFCIKEVGGRLETKWNGKSTLQSSECISVDTVKHCQTSPTHYYYLIKVNICGYVRL